MANNKERHSCLSAVSLPLLRHTDMESSASTETIRYPYHLCSQCHSVSHCPEVEPHDPDHHQLMADGHLHLEGQRIYVITFLEIQTNRPILLGMAHKL